MSNENPSQGQGQNEERSSSRISRIFDWVVSKGVTIPILFAALLVVIGLYKYGINPMRVVDVAVDRYKQAELKAASVKRHLRLGNSFLNVGRPDVAKTEYEQALKLDSNNAQAQLGFRISELSVQAREVAIDPLIIKENEEVISDEESGYFVGPSQDAQDLDAAHRSHLLVFLAEVRKDYVGTDEALEMFQEAADLNPDNSHAFYNMGLIHDQQNEPDKALENYQNAFATSPWNSSYQNNVAFALYENKQYQEAARHYEDLLRGDPLVITPYFELPIVHRILGDLEAAHATQTHLIERLLEDDAVTSLERNQGGLFYAIDPQSRPVFLYEDPEKKYYAYYSIALTSHLLGDEEEAEGHVDRARNLQIDPDLESEVERLMEHDIQILQEEQDRFRDEADDFKNKFLKQEETGPAAAVSTKAESKAGNTEAKAGSVQAKTLPSTGGASIVIALLGPGAAALLVVSGLLVHRITR